ncbi:MAG: segregation and condensation protein [Actinomycetota bacterium]|nr:segregation and condensation protein [Actinomycetota bacterium]
MNERKIVESILFLAEEPLPAARIGEVLERPTADVEELVATLAASYVEEDRGFELRQTAGGWRLYTTEDCAPWLERFVRGQTIGRLTGPSLEVLAIVAYRQPVSRSEIADIRGVDSDGVVKTLVQRGLLEESGRENGPGNPALFSVTDDFLERLGLPSLEELPPLSSFLPDTETVEDMESRLSPGV